MVVHHILRLYSVEFRGLQGKHNRASARNFLRRTFGFTSLPLFIKATTQKRNWLLTFLVLLPRCLIPYLHISQTKIINLTAEATVCVNPIVPGWCNRNADVCLYSRASPKPQRPIRWGAAFPLSLLIISFSLMN